MKRKISSLVLSLVVLLGILYTSSGLVAAWDDDNVLSFEIERNENIEPTKVTIFPLYIGEMVIAENTIKIGGYTVTHSEIVIGRESGSDKLILNDYIMIPRKGAVEIEYPHSYTKGIKTLKFCLEVAEESLVIYI